MHVPNYDIKVIFGDISMNSLTALSISIGVLAGVATFLAVGPMSGIFFIWAATIAWAAYFALGGDKEALVNTIVCGIFGVFMAWITAIIITNIPADAALGFPLMAAIAVTVAVIVLCLAANIPALATIPASVLGYSATFAYLLQTPDKLTPDVLLGVSLDNPLVVISISIVIGTYFGEWSALLSAKLTTESD
jgi:ABC-type Co2+ transport system permease subunit